MALQVPAPTRRFRHHIAEAFRFLEFLDLSNAHFLVPLWVTKSCTEMKAEGALESCDFGLPKIASVPPRL